MKDLGKRLLYLLMASIMVISLFAGCSSSSTSSSDDADEDTTSEDSEEDSDADEDATSEDSDADESEDVETDTTLEVENVTMYQVTFGTATDDAVDRILDAVNVILEEEYQVHLDIKFLSSSDYATQTNLAMTTNEVDVLTTLAGWNDIQTLVNNNQIIALDDYYDNASEELQAVFTEEELAGMTFNGSLYALNRKYLVAGQMDLIMSEEIVNELGIDVDSIESYEDIDAVLTQVHEAYPDIYTLVPGSNSSMCQIEWITGDDMSGGYDLITLPVGTSGTAEDLVYSFENELFVEWCTWMHTWYEEGIVMADVLSNTTNGSDYISAGQAFAYFSNGDIYEPDEGMVKATAVITGEARVLATGFTNVGYSISTNSEHQDAAWRFLEAIYTNAEVANLIAYGEEDVDYVVNDDGTVDYPEGVDSSTADYAGVSQPMLWPNYTIMYPTVSQGADYIEIVEEYNASAVSNPAVGFIWDSSEYTDQITACTNVHDKYYDSLEAGILDPETAIPEIMEELVAAGIEDIMASVQEQYAEFLAESE